MAAVLACGPGAVLSHRDAAHLHEIRARTAPGSRSPFRAAATDAHDGIEVHRSTTLTDADVTIDRRDPLHDARPHDPGPGRRRLASASVERAMEQAEMLQTLDARALEDQLERNVTAHSAGRLRAVLAATSQGRPRPRASSKSACWRCAAPSVCPAPQRQFYVDPGDGEPMVRVDFAWPRAAADRSRPTAAGTTARPRVRVRPPPRSAADRRPDGAFPDHLAPAARGARADRGDADRDARRRVTARSGRA